MLVVLVAAAAGISLRHARAPTKVGIYDGWNNQRKRIADRPTTVVIKCFRSTGSNNHNSNSNSHSHSNNNTLLSAADVKVMHEDYHMICSKARSGHLATLQAQYFGCQVAAADVAAAVTGNSIRCCRLSTGADRACVALHLMTSLRMSLHAPHYLNVTANE